jgi:hypothetical protein
LPMDWPCALAAEIGACLEHSGCSHLSLLASGPVRGASGDHAAALRVLLSSQSWSTGQGRFPPALAMLTPAVP